MAGIVIMGGIVQLLVQVTAVTGAYMVLMLEECRATMTMLLIDMFPPHL